MADDQETFRLAARTGTDFRIDALPVSEPGPGETRVRNVACGVCVTEVHYVGASVLITGGGSNGLLSPLPKLELDPIISEPGAIE